jgi:hypothetical protein
MLQQRIGHFAASFFPQFAMKFSYTLNISLPPLFASQLRFHGDSSPAHCAKKLVPHHVVPSIIFSRAFSKDYEQKIASDEVWRDFSR